MLLWTALSFLLFTSRVVLSTSSAKNYPKFSLFKEELIDRLSKQCYPWQSQFIPDLAKSPIELERQSTVYLKGIEPVLEKFYDSFTATYGKFGFSGDTLVQLIDCYCHIFALNSSLWYFLDETQTNDLKKATIQGKTFSTPLKIEHLFWILPIAPDWVPRIATIIKFSNTSAATLNQLKDSNKVINRWLVLSSGNSVGSFLRIDPFGLIHFSINYYLDKQKKIDCTTVDAFLTSVKLYVGKREYELIGEFLSEALSKFPSTINRTPTNVGAFLARVIQMLHSLGAFNLRYLADYQTLLASSTAIQGKIKEGEDEFSIKSIVIIIYEQVLSPKIVNLLLEIVGKKLAEGKFLDYSDLLSESEVKRLVKVDRKRLRKPEYFFVSFSVMFIFFITTKLVVQMSKKK